MTVSGGKGAGLVFDIISWTVRRLLPRGYPRNPATPEESKPVYSMTGYASGQQSIAPAASGHDGKGAAQARIGFEIRSVNSRFLDLSFRLSEDLRQHEPTLRD